MKPSSRDLLLTWLAQWLARSKRHANQNFALLVVALDGGDSDRLRQLVRAEDTVLELEDNKVAIVAADLRHVSDPLRMVLRIQTALPGQVSGVGIALSASRHGSALEMLQKAEAAAQTDRPYVDGELQKVAEERLELERDLGEAIKQGQILPYFQPIVELASGQITSFEALARWEHPKRGSLLPKEFLGVASDCGLLPELDLCILEQSLEQLSRWQRETERPIRLSVNLCAEHFLRPGGINRLRPLLDRYTHVIAQLRVDVSEQVLSEPQGVQALRDLRDLKVGFHLDDFGVGPESFHCLASFPFHSLKIDRSLICEMEEEVNAELIAALLRIARRMKMRTIAEGLVTHAQLEELRNLGCNEAQGFLFSAAVKADAALALLQEEHCW